MFLYFSCVVVAIEYHFQAYKSIDVLQFVFVSLVIAFQKSTAIQCAVSAWPFKSPANKWAFYVCFCVCVYWIEYLTRIGDSSSFDRKMRTKWTWAHLKLSQILGNIVASSLQTSFNPLEISCYTNVQCVLTWCTVTFWLIIAPLWFPFRLLLLKLGKCCLVTVSSSS